MSAIRKIIKICLFAGLVYSGLILWTVSDAQARVWTVYPAGKAVEGANVIVGFSSIDWSKIQPGDVLEIKGSQGSFKESLVIAVRGTKTAPIIVRAVSGETPVIENSIVITDSAYVHVEGLTVTGSAYAGIIIQKGSNHITIADNDIHDNALGIWIGNQAGDSNMVLNNRVYNNSTHGIAVDSVNCASGKETVISSNEVYGNGHHGIEILGSYYIVEGNVVYQNGAAVSGTSGIHIFSRSPQEDSGDHNVIRYNVVFQNKESNGPDGNGIQLDQWCDYNEVYYNICFDNDGAGISIYDSSDSKVYNNTLVGNMIDPGKSHPFKAELYLASDVANNVNHVQNVTVVNNILVAVRPGVPAIAVYSPVTGNPISIGHNLLYHKAGDAIFYWGGTKGKDITTWNKKAAGGGDDLYGDPLFVSLQGTTPSQVSDLRLKTGSPAIDKGINLGQSRDISGNNVPQGNGVDIGALEALASAPSPPETEKPAPPRNLKVIQ